MPIVLDASIAVALVVAERRSEQARQVLLGDHELIAPDWMITEVASAIAGKVRRDELSLVDAGHALEAAPRFVDRFVPTGTLLKRTIALAAQIRHTFYDCLYLAVALEEQGRVVTADKVFYEKAVTAGFAELVELLA